MKQAGWHVLGAGAIGCLFAAALHRARCPVTLILRELVASNSCALVVEREERRTEIQLPSSSATAGGPISHLLVTTKAYDVGSALTAISHRLDRASVVLLLVNGMGFADELPPDFAPPTLCFGTTTEGAYRLGPRHIRHAGRGATRIGQAGLRAPPDWFEPWPRAIQPCLWDGDIEQALWLKLAINCAINPLTALHRCANGELATRSALATEVQQLCDEIALISEAAGFTRTAASVHGAVAEVIAGTAANRSSMLQDVQAGRRTEVDYITGHLLGVARAHGIDAPANEHLLTGIQRLEPQCRAQ